MLVEVDECVGDLNDYASLLLYFHFFFSCFNLLMYYSFALKA